MLPLPKEPTNPIKLADWLEINAQLAADHNMSSGDLRSAIRTAALLSIKKEELLILDVFSEIDRRFSAAGLAYPFDISGGVLTAKRRYKKFLPYLFCLCLSYFGWKQRIGATTFPRRLFEDLACDAAQNYIKGYAVRFASPRKSLPSNFKAAITYLCLNCINEGGGYRKKPSLSSKDDTVDVIAWSDFPDKLSGKLLLFGACATGNNWETKITELQPVPFCNEWMIEQPVSQLIKAFFIPHRVDLKYWNKHSRRGGVIFDRCRISYWKVKDSISVGAWDTGKCKEWVNMQLQRQ